jgi:hypothetical protein
MAHHAIGIKVSIKIVFVMPVAQKTEDEETDDAEGCYSAYHTANDGPSVRTGRMGGGRCLRNADGSHGIYSCYRHTIT